MKYKVRAISDGRTRTETIDTQRNELFSGIKTPLGVKRRYENFWLGTVNVLGVKRAKR